MTGTPWGVDLSPTYNPVVDAGAVAAAGASYVVLKVSEGVGWPSERHAEEFSWFGRVAAGVVAAGLELRVYHLATPLDRRDALAEATWFDRHLDKMLPASVAYDLERLDPRITPAQHADIFEAWRETIASFLPRVPIELYCNRSVIRQLDAVLPQRGALWLAWPGWTPDDAGTVGVNVVRVQIGQRTFPGVAGNVDVNVSPGATPDDVAQALGHAAPSTPPAQTPKIPAPQHNSDWSLTVRTLDLRNAAAKHVTGGSVKSLQTLLNLGLGMGLAVDGIGGRETRAALFTFQERHGLVPDAIAGPKTWETLCLQ